MKNNKQLPRSTKFLLTLANDLLKHTFNTTDAFLFSCGSAKILASRLNMTNRQYYSALDSFRRHGYIKRVNTDQFLITPKAITHARIAKIDSGNWENQSWDGSWKLIAFDIPEKRRSERDMFRSLLKRKGFVGLQNSVFISPFADFKELALLRRDLKIEKHVSFFVAKSHQSDDDSALRKRFGL